MISDNSSVIEKKEEDEVFRILWNTGDTFKLNVDQLPVEISNNQIVCITPHQQISFSGNPTGLRAFIFNRSFYCIHENDHEVSCEGLLFYGNSNVSRIDLNEEEKEKFESLFKVFLDEVTTNDSIQEQMLRMLLKRLIIKCTRIARKQNIGQNISEANVDLIRKFNILVEKHFREKKSVKEYASLLHKSPKTLSNLFSRVSDKTPLKVIHSRVVLEGKRLMIHTDKTTKQIAYDLGYEEVPYFSRLFKKETGMSPTQFRKQAMT